MPDGRVVPRVSKEYTYLGSAEPATWENAQEGVRKQVVRTCSQLMRMVGRAGGLGERQFRVALGLAVEGTIGFYGRATAIGWEACEEIERVRAEVLRQRGFASGAPYGRPLPDSHGSSAWAWWGRVRRRLSLRRFL